MSVEPESLEPCSPETKFSPEANSKPDGGELKGCPFCGASGRRGLAYDTRNVYEVMCTACDALAGSVETWNRRAPASELASLLASYTRHNLGCERNSFPAKVSEFETKRRPCTCGLDDLLVRVKENGK